jgi:uncharacterized protein
MSRFDAIAIVEGMFLHFRKPLGLGMSEYFAAIDAIRGGWGTQTLADLQAVLQLLWCKSPIDRARLAMEWDDVIQQIQSHLGEAAVVSDRWLPPTEQTSPEPGTPPPLLPTATPPTPIPTETDPEFQPEPIKTQPTRSLELEETAFFRANYPITRRSMSYCWRSLRRYQLTGPATAVDVAATIDRVSRQGFFLAPVYRPERRNQAGLLLLVDRNGSMTPFHHFTRDLVETACYESALEPDRVEVAYFHNVPAASVFRDTYLTQPIPLTQILDRCDRNTGVILVSDAGSARGERRSSRIRATIRILRQIRQQTAAIVWLNPMPESRWVDTTAQILLHLVPMFPMDEFGLNQAIDVIRSQLGE